jgi:hypothetical protein
MEIKSVRAAWLEVGQYDPIPRPHVFYIYIYIYTRLPFLNKKWGGIAGEGKKRVWNEKLTFNADYPGGEDHKYKLTFHIMDKHKTSHDVFVGETT